MRAIVLALAVWVSAAAGQDVLTWHNDLARTGQNPRESVLTLANVNTKTFCKLFVIAVDGKVDAEPLYVHGLQMPNRGTRNTLFVATEHDSVYAFDADSGQEFWHVRLLGASETTSDDRNCG
jgi:outer membrane protein assembly factor BamB